MNIVKNLVDKSKYGIKCPYEMKPTRIVVHETANDASAQNEVAYMTRNNNEVSFHYAADDVEVVQGIPEDRNAWHSGDGGNGKGNREGIAIEICYSKSGGERWKKAVDNAATFIAQKLKEKGWGIDKVTKHQDYNGKHCPHRILDEYGWNNFIKLVESKLNPVAEAETYKVVTPINKYSSSSDAKNKKNSKGKFAVGTYYIFNKYPKGYNGMYNITTDKTGSSAGSWINPTENIVHTTVAKQVKAGDKVKVKSGAKTYTGGKLASFVYKTVYTVLEEPKGERVVIGLNGVVTAAINIKDLLIV